MDQGMGAPQAPQGAAPQGGSSLKWLIIILVILLVIAVGYWAYTKYFAGSASTTASPSPVVTTAKPSPKVSTSAVATPSASARASASPSARASASPSVSPSAR